MKIIILDYRKEEYNSLIGKFDVKIEHNSEKYEIFRDVGHFKKENREWISLRAVKIKGKWIQIYERPGLKETIKDIFQDLKSWLKAREEKGGFEI